MPPGPDDKRGLRRLSRQIGAPAVDVDALVVPRDVLELVPEDVMRRRQVLPVRLAEGQLFVAIANPQNSSALDEVAFRTGQKVVGYAAIAERLDLAIEAAIGARRRGEPAWRGPHAVGDGTSAFESAAVRPDDPDPEDGIPINLDTDPPAGPPPLGTPPAATPAQARRARISLPEPFKDESSFKPRESSSGPTARTRPRLLIVDDEPVIRQILKQGLLPRGLEVIEAGSGAEALRLVKEREPDAILLDAMLPDVHGFDICKRLRESPRYQHVPIVMITAVYKGWRMAADLKEAYGVYAYIEKPFDIRDVVTTVDNALAGRSPAAERKSESYGADAKRLYAEASEAFRRGDLDSAIAGMASAVAIEPLSASLRHQLGLLFAQRGHDFQAIQELEMAIDLEPSRYQSLRNLAILFQRRGFRRKSCEMWERAMGCAPDDAARQEIREILLQLL